MIRTNLGRHMPWISRVVFAGVGPLFLKSIPEGAATQCYAAVHPAAASANGKYFADVNEAPPRKDARDPDLARRLWDTTERIVAGL